MANPSTTSHPATPIIPLPSKDDVIFEKDTKVAVARAGFDSKNSNKLLNVARRRTISDGATGFRPMFFQTQDHNLNPVDESLSKNQIGSKAPKDTSPRRSSIFKNPTVQLKRQSVSTPAT
jgi:hypothetical protein